MTDYDGPHWPPARFLVERNSVPNHQWRLLRDLLKDNASERQIDQLLRQHPNLLGGVSHFHRPNAHASWVIPQASIRAPFSPDQRGMRPDFIVGGVGSDGLTWVVLELKSAADQIFVCDRDGSGIRLSAAANRGVCQLLSYLDYCSANQAHLREFLNTRSFREPTGILIIGRASELESDQRRQVLKSALNRAFAGRLEIRTFDSLVVSLINVAAPV